MTIIAQNSRDAFTVTTPEPHVRDLKVLISPEIQEEVKDLSVGMTILPPGNSSSYHAHDAEAETWIIVSGRGEVVVDDERLSVGPETVVHLPRNSRHQIVNTGRETLRMFWVYTPPGGERVVLDGKMG
ncbi:MAG: cupin domain-containing protein [Deltaproteobacteria bacterium]|nr:cupin domain-containing protein [Deltaproteobacteria bacterium]MBW1924313.1 cupin domain-containing protein [Deltaproteobacteria bacterium]MBW1950141.1 cupin domain-containing protein [Deltaproteobacteria bacterium]MBW2009344.1 cupin domain-containing protein [Deltaproteobacteria bacterium]MBW2102499.1 cupin domain-containing protein [Deltaproteobacteria bacterium]